MRDARSLFDAVRLRMTVSLARPAPSAVGRGDYRVWPTVGESAFGSAPCVETVECRTAYTAPRAGRRILVFLACCRHSFGMDLRDAKTRRDGSMVP